MAHVAEAVRRAGYVAPAPETREVRSRGDVRYFFREDEKTAIALQQVVESALASEGFNMRLEVRYVDAKTLPNARQNRLEAWIPSLRQRLATAQ